MRKVIICSMPFRANIQKVVYKNQDISVQTSEQAVRFPINALIESNIHNGDSLQILLLVKKDKNKFYESNKELFLKELEETIGDREVDITTEIIYTDFIEEKQVHEELLGKIVDNIEDDSNIIADITYGPKDMPIIIFSALNFCEKHLNCTIDAIVYGLAQFNGDNEIVEGKMCDMTSLFYLNTLSETINSRDSKQARQLLRTLLEL